MNDIQIKPVEFTKTIKCVVGNKINYLYFKAFTKRRGNPKNIFGSNNQIILN